jgi:hypothetical protein
MSDAAGEDQGYERGGEERDELRRRARETDSELRESPETPLERPEGEEAWVDATGSQERAERRWWEFWR